MFDVELLVFLAGGFLHHCLCILTESLTSDEGLLLFTHHFLHAPPWRRQVITHPPCLNLQFLRQFPRRLRRVKRGVAGRSESVSSLWYYRVIFFHNPGCHRLHEFRDSIRVYVAPGTR